MRVEIGDDALAGDVAIEALVNAGFGPVSHVNDAGGLVHDVDAGQVVALAEGEVVGVVCGCDFDGSGAEVAADPFIEDDGDFAAD